MRNSAAEDEKEELLTIVIQDYGDYLKRTAFLILGDIGWAEDVVQEAFIQFYKNIHRIRKHSSIKTYLYTILINQCRQKMRKNYLKRESVSAYIQEEMERYIRGQENQADKLYLRQCLSKLRPKDQEVIILFYYQDLSIQEISAMCSEKEGTIKSRLKRARDRLKKYYEGGEL